MDLWWTKFLGFFWKGGKYVFTKEDEIRRIDGALEALKIGDANEAESILRGWKSKTNIPNDINTWQFHAFAGLLLLCSGRKESAKFLIDQALVILKDLPLFKTTVVPHRGKIIELLEEARKLAAGTTLLSIRVLANMTLRLVRLLII